MSNLDAFRATAICNGLDEAAAAQLYALATPVSFVKGSRLVRQGEASRGAYLLREGSVEARVSLPGGGDKVVAVLGPNSMFGEMALIENGLTTASVVAVTNVDGWFIERDPFRALTAGRNAGALRIQRTITLALVERLGALNAELRKHPSPEDRPAAEAEPCALKPERDFRWREFLPILPFFAGFSADEIDACVAGARAMECPRGGWVFANGGAATSCYLVVRGAVEANARIGDRERRMALLGPGALVGYLSVLRGTPHGAGARVREDATLLEFPAAVFMAMFDGTSGVDVKFQHAIHKSLLQSLARSNGQLSRLVTQAALAESLKAKAAAAAL